MVYNVIGCEGNSELYVVKYLIEHDSFFLCPDDMFDNRPLHIRQLKDIASQINSLPIDADINVYRIGDTQKDKYDLDPFELRKARINIINVCTKPEIEMLIIINEGLLNDFQKRKMKPKTFLRQFHPEISNIKDYLENHNILPAIKEYKHYKKHNSNELYLADFVIEKKNE